MNSFNEKKLKIMSVLLRHGETRELLASRIAEEFFEKPQVIGYQAIIVTTLLKLMCEQGWLTTRRLRVESAAAPRNVWKPTEFGILSYQKEIQSQDELNVIPEENALEIFNKNLTAWPLDVDNNICKG